MADAELKTFEVVVVSAAIATVKAASKEEAREKTDRCEFDTPHDATSWVAMDSTLKLKGSPR
jgi:hypothetical protein